MLPASTLYSLTTKESGTEEDISLKALKDIYDCIISYKQLKVINKQWTV